jgi:selenocysteine lyase/cysteine desulfurase
VNSLVSPEDFLNLGGKTHLYTAAECPLLVQSAQAVSEYIAMKSEAERGRSVHDDITASCRAHVADLFGGTPGEIAFLGSASDAINAVAGILPFSPGDNVVVNDLEFSSVVLPWMRLRAQGLEVRVVHHDNWEIPTEAIMGAVDSRTRLVALSHVSYVNGWRHDVTALSDALARTNARILLDVTQSAGIFPIDARRADFIVASTYKWLLGTHGLGILYVNKDRVALEEPRAIGWYSVLSNFDDDRYERYALREGAGRFETGYLNFPAIYALNASVPYLKALDPVTVVSHVHTLGDELITGLRELDLVVTTPESRSERGSSVTFLHRDAERIGAALARQDVHVWAGDGRVRASPNIFNSSNDISMLLDCLAVILRDSEKESRV